MKIMANSQIVTTALQKEIEDKVKAAVPMEGSGKFDLNINVRFLLR